MATNRSPDAAFDPVAQLVPTDPGFASAWHLNAALSPAANLRVSALWSEYTGAGVVVGVVDDGIDYGHPDLASRYRHDLDWDARNNDADAFATAGNDAHGTAVAGVIAAAFNGSGMLGVAPGAEIAGFRMGYGADGSLAQVLAQVTNIATVDVANNSWSFGGVFTDNFRSPAFSAHGQALQNAVAAGRDGLGTVIVFAAGNAYESGDNVNYHNFQNSPYAIAVGAIDSSGKIASFSTPGSAVLVSGPGVAVNTTDAVGSRGYAAGDAAIVSGTSFAAPAVSGVAALMLEANPALGYRDIQEILALTARNTDPGHSGWQTNGASHWNGGGMQVSDSYGFGLVDAHAAVRLAETWEGQGTFHNRHQLGASAAPGLAIIDHGSVTSSISIAGGLEIQRVGVDLDLTHTWIGDLTVTLTSPAGTRSILVNRPGWGDASADDIHFTFDSVQFWGESGAGTWRLTVSDGEVGNTGRLDAWTLRLTGDQHTGDDLYVYTDAWSTLAAAPARQTVVDDKGIDTLNFAAVTGDVRQDLLPGVANTFLGRSLNVAGGTQIENGVGGDGNDAFYGNGADNWLRGMRGDDLLVGRFGADILEGGDGNDTLYGDDVSGYPDGIPGIRYAPDRLYGGSGNDDLHGEGGGDLLDGGEGIDRANYENSPFGITVVLATNVGYGPGYAAGDSYADIESVRGTRFDDILIGDVGDNVLEGGEGRDFLVGSLGADIVAGGPGRDVFVISSVAEGGDVLADFDPAVDEVLDLSTLFAAHRLSRTDAFAAGILRVADLDGSGRHSVVNLDLDGFAGGAAPFTLFTLVDIAPFELDFATHFVI
jgi:subtilisin-like proprotein convertase family protein